MDISSMSNVQIAMFLIGIAVLLTILAAPIACNQIIRKTANAMIELCGFGTYAVSRGITDLHQPKKLLKKRKGKPAERTLWQIVCQWWCWTTERTEKLQYWQVKGIYEITDQNQDQDRVSP